MQRYLFAFVVAAAALGWLLSQVDGGSLAELMALLKTLFLSVLKMVVAPLVFFSLLAGILRLRAAADLTRLSAVTLTYYFCTTAIAIAVGLLVVFWIHPWTAVPPPADLAATTVGFHCRRRRLRQCPVARRSARRLVRRLFINPFAALAELNILGIVAGGVVLGLALLVALPKESRVPAAIDDITAAIYRVAGWAVTLVPFGVLAIVYQMSTTSGTELLQGLAAFAAVVVGATLCHGLVVLPLIAWLAGGRNPLQFARDAGRAVIVALSTSSSAATLPVTFQSAQALGVDRTTASFVLPLGATINMDGTALFEGIAACVSGVPVWHPARPTRHRYGVSRGDDVVHRCAWHSLRLNGGDADGAAGGGHSARRHRRAAAGGTALGRGAHSRERGGRLGGFAGGVALCRHSRRSRRVGAGLEDAPSMNVAIIGSGYVGLVTGACFAEMGNDVLCVDVDAAKVARLQAGEVSVFEPGLEQLVRMNQRAGRLTFATDAQCGVAHGEVVFIAVGTPADEDGAAYLGHVHAAAAPSASTWRNPPSSSSNRPCRWVLPIASRRPSPRRSLDARPTSVSP